MLTVMKKPTAKTNVERTPAGLQMVLPGCEGRTLPKSTSRVDAAGQGLLHFFKPPSLREQLEKAADAPLRSSRGQTAMPKSGSFSSFELQNKKRLANTRSPCQYSVISGTTTETVAINNLWRMITIVELAFSGTNAATIHTSDKGAE